MLGDPADGEAGWEGDDGCTEAKPPAGACAHVPESLLQAGGAQSACSWPVFSGSRKQVGPPGPRERSRKLPHDKALEEQDNGPSFPRGRDV